MFQNSQNYNQNNQSQNNNNSNENQYLTTRLINNISNQQFNSYLANNFDTNNLMNLKNTIINLNLPNPESIPRPAIGKFTFLTKLIEQYYNFDSNKKTLMKNKYSLLSQDIFKYRSIRGDGNCFYRAVIFSFIEQIILFNEINMFKNLIIDIKNCFNDYYLRNFRSDLIQKILVLCYIALNKGKIEQSYEIFVKAILNNSQFDQGLIMYLRFCIFRYIKENENKLYSNEFPVKIGNLLPAEYETEKGDFLFEKFYSEFLLKMGKDAEKIVIYLTPFVLCVKLEIVMFDIENDFRKVFNYYGNNPFNKQLSIVLSNKKNHYELIYTKEFYQMNYEILKKYTDNSYVNKILTEIKNNEKLIQTNLVQIEPILNNNNNNNNNSNKNQNLLNFTPIINNNSNTNTNINLNNINNNNNMNIQNQNFNLGNVCTICKNSRYFDFKYQLCQNCFLSIFKGQFIEKYFMCIQKLQNYLQKCNDSSDYSRALMELFNKEKILISNKQIEIQNAIILINNYLPQNNKIYLNALISQVKNLFCLQCHKKVIQNNQKLFIPCGCFFCSYNCIIEHFTNFNKLELKKKSNDFCCVCSSIYESFHILNLVFTFKKINNEFLINKSLNLFKEISKNKCSKCNNIIKGIESNVVYVKCKNEGFDPNWRMLGDNFTFNHMMCYECFRFLDNSKYFCVFCKNEHFVIGKNNNDENICYIF